MEPKPSVFAVDAASRAYLLEVLRNGGVIAACLCADWCTNCRTWRTTFDTLPALAQKWQQPDLPLCFSWIDIEDESDWLGDDVDIDNFPTLLIQRGDLVVFSGPIEPGAEHALRLIRNAMEQSLEALRTLTLRDPLRRSWQTSVNLLKLLDF